MDHQSSAEQAISETARLACSRDTKQSDGERFYTIQNGVRLSGMPAFSEEHTAAQTWRLVLFIRHLPQITPDELNQMKGWDQKSEADPAHF